MSERPQLRDAYVPSRRVRVGSDVAATCAATLLLGLVGSAVTWWGRSDLFDLASSPGEVVKMNLGYLAGPAAIVCALPLLFGRSRQVARRRLFRTRLAIAALLWLGGLATLLSKVVGLGPQYTVEGGTYAAAALLVLGLLGTLAMWPGSLRVVQVDRQGRVREALSAAGSRARSRMGP